MKVPKLNLKTKLVLVDWSTVVQVVGVLAVLAGIGAWSIPAALIVGGLTAIAAVVIRDIAERNRRSVAYVAKTNEDKRTKVYIEQAVRAGHNPLDNPSVKGVWADYAAMLMERKG